MEDGFVVCRECGSEVDEAQVALYGEEFVCPDCLEHYFCCSHCDALTYEDDRTEFEGESWCQACVDDHLQSCELCSELFNPRYGDCWGGMCPGCSEEHFECEDCGRICHNDDYGSGGCCSTCENQSAGYIRPYHSPPPLVFHPHSGESLYFGVELETEDYPDRKEAAEALHQLSDDEELFFLEEDASLHNGIEIISQPATLDFHRDSFPWKEITDKVRSLHGRAFSGRRSALHIHFSTAFFRDENEELYELRLIYIVEKFWAELTKFARPTEYLLRRSAMKYSTDLYDKPAKQKIWELKNNYSRMQAVNLQNRNTIELRFFRSTLNWEVILAYLELVDFLVHLVRNKSTLKLQAITWEGMLKKMSLKDYRHLLPQLKRITGGEDEP